MKIFKKPLIISLISILLISMILPSLNYQVQAEDNILPPPSKLKDVDNIFPYAFVKDSLNEDKLIPYYVVPVVIGEVYNKHLERYEVDPIYPDKHYDTIQEFSKSPITIQNIASKNYRNNEYQYSIAVFRGDTLLEYIPHPYDEFSSWDDWYIANMLIDGPDQLLKPQYKFSYLSKTKASIALPIITDFQNKRDFQTKRIVYLMYAYENGLYKTGLGDTKELLKQYAYALYETDISKEGAGRSGNQFVAFDKVYGSSDIDNPKKFVSDLKIQLSGMTNTEVNTAQTNDKALLMQNLLNYEGLLFNTVLSVAYAHIPYVSIFPLSSKLLLDTNLGYQYIDESTLNKPVFPSSNRPLYIPNATEVSFKYIPSEDVKPLMYEMATNGFIRENKDGSLSMGHLFQIAYCIEFSPDLCRDIYGVYYDIFVATGTKYTVDDPIFHIDVHDSIWRAGGLGDNRTDAEIKELADNARIKLSDLEYKVADYKLTPEFLVEVQRLYRETKFEIDKLPNGTDINMLYVRLNAVLEKISYIESLTTVQLNLDNVKFSTLVANLEDNEVLSEVKTNIEYVEDMVNNLDDSNEKTIFLSEIEYLKNYVNEKEINNDFSSRLNKINEYKNNNSLKETSNLNTITSMVSELEQFILSTNLSEEDKEQLNNSLSPIKAEIEEYKSFIEIQYELKTLKSQVFAHSITDNDTSLLEDKVINLQNKINSLTIIEKTELLEKLLVIKEHLNYKSFLIDINSELSDIEVISQKSKLTKDEIVELRKRLFFVEHSINSIANSEEKTEFTTKLNNINNRLDQKFLSLNIEEYFSILEKSFDSDVLKEEEINSIKDDINSLNDLISEVQNETLKGQYSERLNQIKSNLNVSENTLKVMNTVIELENTFNQGLNNEKDTSSFKNEYNNVLVQVNALPNSELKTNLLNKLTVMNEFVIDLEKSIKAANSMKELEEYFNNIYVSKEFSEKGQVLLNNAKTLVSSLNNSEQSDTFMKSIQHYELVVKDINHLLSINEELKVLEVQVANKNANTNDAKTKLNHLNEQVNSIENINTTNTLQTIDTLLIKINSIENYNLLNDKIISLQESLSSIRNLKDVQTAETTLSNIKNEINLTTNVAYKEELISFVAKVEKELLLIKEEMIKVKKEKAEEKEQVAQKPVVEEKKEETKQEVINKPKKETKPTTVEKETTKKVNTYIPTPKVTDSGTNSTINNVVTTVKEKVNEVALEIKETAKKLNVSEKVLSMFREKTVQTEDTTVIKMNRENIIFDIKVNQ